MSLWFKRTAAAAGVLLLVPVLLAAVSQFTAVISLPNIATLKGLGAASSFYPNIIVQGYTAAGDGWSSNFVWDGSSTATTTLCGPFAATGVATGRWISQSGISLRGCGAKGDGSTDDSASVQAAFNSAGGITIERGNFFITTTIVPVSNDQVIGLPGATISYDFSGATHVGCAISGNDVSNFSIRYVTFQNTTAASSVQYLPICLYHPENIWIEHVTTIATGLGLVDSTASAPVYANTDNTNSPHNIHVNFNNIGNGTTSNTIARSGFLFSYARKCEAVGNAVSGTVFGIYWSGGDANTDGAIANERKAYNCNITGNYVHDTSAGAIWGSMGQNFSITGNTVINGGDVGLDDEGGLNNTWSGNTCSEMTNGCLTTFFLPVGTMFVGNTVNQSVASHPLYRAYNSFLSGSSSVTLQNNVFNYSGASGVGLIDSSNGPVGTLVFANNTLFNAKISFTSSNQHVVTVRGNHLTYSRSIGSAFNAIDVQNTDQDGTTFGVATIAENEVQSQVTQTAGSFAINTLQADANSSPHTTIRGNSTFGFPGDLKTTWSGSNAGVFEFREILGNRFGSAVYTRVESGAANSFGLLIDNVDGNGAYFPAGPGSNYSNVGQQYLNVPPTAGGFIGSVTTTAGAPGTQKDFGAVVP